LWCLGPATMHTCLCQFSTCSGIVLYHAVATCPV
jgi:hypothetical protein